MRTGITRCVNGLEEQPLRERKPEFQQQADAAGYGYVNENGNDGKSGQSEGAGDSQ
jgi:hypothetical protein